MTRAIDVAQFIFAEYKAISGKIIDEMKTTQVTLSFSTRIYIYY